MLNTNVTVGRPTVTNNVSIQSCSGGIYKSHPKSRIVRLYIDSERAGEMLSSNQEPIVYDRDKNKKEVVILQVVNAVEGYVLVEYMYKEDYEAENVYFNPDGSGIEDE